MTAIIYVVVIDPIYTVAVPLGGCLKLKETKDPKQDSVMGMMNSCLTKSSI